MSLNRESPCLWRKPINFYDGSKTNFFQIIRYLENEYREETRFQQTPRRPSPDLSSVPWTNHTAYVNTRFVCWSNPILVQKLEKKYELVAAHISHDAYGHKFNEEGHVFDEDLFYDMKQALYSPVTGWLQHDAFLKLVKHRPLLPGNVAYYGLAPFKEKIYLISLVDEFKTYGERHSASMQRMASRGHEIATGLVYCNIQNNNQSYCPNRLVSDPLASYSCPEEYCSCKEPLRYDVHTLNMPGLTKVSIFVTFYLPLPIVFQ